MKKVIVSLCFVLLASVVSIQILSPPAASEQIDKGQRFINEYGKHIVQLSGARGGGTGFEVKTPSGKVVTVTNAHVCELNQAGAMQATSVLFPDRKFIIRVLEMSTLTDLCILEPLPTTPGLELAFSENPHGLLYVLGHPFLKPLTLSTGYVTRMDYIDLVQEGEECVGEQKKMKEIMTFFGPVSVCVRSFLAYGTSIEIYPGNSGSPVLNGNGDVVGVVFASDGRDNKGYFIPLNFLADMLRAY